jgi:hypothetical protein
MTARAIWILTPPGKTPQAGGQQPSLADSSRRGTVSSSADESRDTERAWQQQSAVSAHPIVQTEPPRGRSRARDGLDEISRAQIIQPESRCLMTVASQVNGGPPA